MKSFSDRLDVTNIWWFIRSRYEIGVITATYFCLVIRQWSIFTIKCFLIVLTAEVSIPHALLANDHIHCLCCLYFTVGDLLELSKSNLVQGRMLLCQKPFLVVTPDSEMMLKHSKVHMSCWRISLSLDKMLKRWQRQIILSLCCWTFLHVFNE